jgi:hypothetical protein
MIMMGTRHYILYKPRVNANVNCELWVILCQCWFTECSKCALVVWKLLMREAMDV